MKAKIVEIQNQAYEQINVVVEIQKNDGTVLRTRVFTLPDDMFSNMTREELSNWIVEQAQVNKRAESKYAAFKTLEGTILDV